MNPIDLKGPDFLAFYIFLLIAGSAFAALYRWYLRQPADEPGRESLNLSPYEVTYLAGGSALTCRAAIVRLVHDDVLHAETANRKICVCGELPPDANDIEGAVYRRAKSGISADNRTALSACAQREVRPIHSRLVSAGLVLSPSQDLVARILPAVVVTCVLALGIAKICVGIYRDRPVGFLVILCLVTAWVAMAFCKSPHRTRRGDKAMAKLKQSNAALQYCLSRKNDFVSNQDLVLTLGLFGIGVLAGSPLAEVGIAFSPPPGSGGDGGSGCSSGGCGGGGCGGGGCGGCGS